jgi:hypothetical protein
MIDESIEGLIPDHLKEGWRAYSDWWVARYRSGDPLPPGGCFILNRRAILMSELFRLHVEVAHGLGVPFDAVKMELETDSMGRPVPKLDVFPPEDWMPDVPKHVIMAAGGDRAKLIKDYVSGFIAGADRQMRERLSTRLQSLTQIRPELAPGEVERGPVAG